MCQSVKPKVYGAVPLSAKGRKKALHQYTGIVGHYSFWIDTYLDPIWILCNITKAGPMCFSFGRTFDSESILFAVSKKVPFSDLVNTKQESGLVTFLSTCTKGAPFGTGRERELGIWVAFLAAPSLRHWMGLLVLIFWAEGWFLDGPGSKTELVAINSGSWSI